MEMTPRLGAAERGARGVELQCLPAASPPVPAAAQWLTYWVCACTLLLIEKVAWPVLYW